VAILFAGISAAAAEREVSPLTPAPDTNDLIDSAPTSAIPEINSPAGMTSPTVPNDPPGIEPSLSNPTAPATAPLAPMPAN